ncbi:hypothetical protein BH10BAC5_BH10BAC5_03000 [soil metagenome]
MVNNQLFNAPPISISISKFFSIPILNPVSIHLPDSFPEQWTKEFIDPDTKAVVSLKEFPE